MPYKYTNIGDRHPWIDTFFEINASPKATKSRIDLIVPDGTTGILFIEKGSLIRQQGDQSVSLSSNNLYIFGQKTQAVQYHFCEEGCKGFGFKFKPSGIYQLLGCNAQQITNKAINIDDIMPIKKELEISEYRDKNKMNLMLHYLKQIQWHPLSAPVALLSILLSDIHQSNGNIAIQRLAQKYHISYKKIERLFKQYVGITPKLYARIIRFNHCVKYASSHQIKKLTDIAYQNGFFDQMHFIKETRCFTGKLPSEIFFHPTTLLEQKHVEYLNERAY